MEIKQNSFDFVVDIKNMPKEHFIIFLTIEGTEHVEVEVIVSNPHRTIREQIALIVEDFMLPKIDNGGNPVTYLLERLGEDDVPDLLEFEDADGRELNLLDCGVRTGDRLRLIYRPIAGGCGGNNMKEKAYSYEPKITIPKVSGLFSIGSYRDRFFAKGNVFSSVFAPAEICYDSHLLVQVYFHRYEETEMVKELACESQQDVKRRDFIPLQCKIRIGDKVDVHFSVFGRRKLMFEKKSVVWQGSFTKCSFDYHVPFNRPENELSILVMLTANDIPIGEMRFVTRISSSPRKLNTEIVSHEYKRVFISYAHKDESKVKSFHEGLKLCQIDHFFDRSYLKAGDIFPQVIQDYINTADLFVLFWSENAANSEYVQKERKQALERAFPQVKPAEAAKLTIYPMSIEPRAELPSDMKDNYHFGGM